MRLRDLWVILVVFTTASSAEDQPQPTKIPRSTLQTTVLDPEGNPVEGAIIVPWAVRSTLGHGLWNPDELGPVPRVQSEKNGKVQLAYPVFERTGKSRVTNVSVTVLHPDFCRATPEFSVKPFDESVVVLQRGTKLSIGATRTGEDSLLKDAWLLRPGDWIAESQIQAANGRIETEPLPEQDKWLYVVHLPKTGPALFSEPYEWNPDDTESLQVDLEVAPGLTLTGQLSANVPRPVRNGKVLYTCVSLGLNDAPWRVWSSSSAIAPDGTFLIDEIPQGCDVQLVALCDGFVSGRPAAAELSRIKDRYEHLPTSWVFTIPVVWPAEELPETVELSMVATSKLTVLVLDQQQRPLRDASIFVSPNQYWPGYGSQMLGTILDSVGYFRTQKWDSSSMRTWEAKTDAEGVASFLEVPPGDSTLDVVFPDGRTQEYDYKPGKSLTITAPPREQ